jgi:hypothetical protein
VGISATIKFSFGKYQKAELQKIIESISGGDIPGTYVYREGESKIEIRDIDVDQKDKSATAKLVINAIYAPKIDSEKLANALKGKSEQAAKKQIEEIAGVTDVAIKFKNVLPIFPKILPHNSKNISIEVKD